MFTLEEIEDLLSKITPGPWDVDPEGYMGCGSVYTANPHLFGGDIAAPNGDLYPRSGYNPAADIEFIAATPEIVRQLLDHIYSLTDDR